MRGRGGYIGANVTPASAGFNSAASGVWTVREAESLKRAGTWPINSGVIPSIAGLEVWYDAADLSTLFDATTGGSSVAADGAVARWQDKSGNLRHLTQSTSGSRPLRKTSQQGGLDTLSFDGSNDVMSVASSSATFSFLHQADSTVFLVARAGTTANPDAAYIAIATGTGTEGAPNFTLWFEDRNLPEEDYVANENVRVIVGARPGQSAVDTLNNGRNGWTPNAYKLVSLVTRPANATAAQRVAARINGGTSASGNTNSASVNTGSAMADLHVGAPSAGAFYWNGNIAEVVIYNSALSDANRALVEQALIAKWGLT